jgi:DNA-directed RNA polymerase specialized sigma24 family protein
MTCRDISDTMWAEAFQALVLFFRHRLAAEPDELAQQTLVRILRRQDPYQFEKEEDFPKVCFGFAKIIWLEHCRQQKRDSTTLLDPAMPAPAHDSGGQQATEDRIFLEEICRIGETQLKKKEWEMIQQAADSDRSAMAEDLKMGNANNVRVQLHRVRQKLSRLIGVSKREV